MCDLFTSGQGKGNKNLLPFRHRKQTLNTFLNILGKRRQPLDVFLVNAICYILILCVDVYLRDRLAILTYQELSKIIWVWQISPMRPTKGLSVTGLHSNTSKLIMNTKQGRPCHIDVLRAERDPAIPAGHQQHQEQGPHHNHSVRHRQSAVDTGQVWTLDRSYRQLVWLTNTST